MTEGEVVVQRMTSRFEEGDFLGLATLVLELEDLELEDSASGF
jgi:hypothetical protein